MKRYQIAALLVLACVVLAACENRTGTAQPPTVEAPAPAPPPPQAPAPMPAEEEHDEDSPHSGGDKVTSDG